jgi:hypothetical protein
MSLMDALLGRTKQGEGDAEQAALSVSVGSAYQLLLQMPQFTAVASVRPYRLGGTHSTIPTGGVINMLNGCLVSVDDQGLRLTWQLDSYDTPGHSVLLTDVDAIGKFMALMEAQAKSLGLGA